MSVIELQASEVGGESPGAVPGDAGFAALSRLRDAAAQVLAQPWAGRPGPVLGEALVELVTAERMVAAAKALVLGAFDATGQHRVEGHPSAATWVGATTKANPRQVKHQAQQARALREMPLTEAAFASGRIGAEHVAVLVRARTRDVVDEFAADEADLVAAAQTLDFDEFDRKVRDWRSFVQPDKSEKRARDAEQRREGHASRTFDDLVRLDAWLDPLGGAEFLDEFTRIEQELFEADWAEARARVGEHATKRDLRRTAKQRRADAFVEMARRSRAHGHTAGGPRWVLNVMMGWHTLCAEAAATLADLGRCTCQIPPALARLLGGVPSAGGLDRDGRCPTCGGIGDGDLIPTPMPDAGSHPMPEPYAGPPPTRRHGALPDWWHAPDPFAPGFAHLRVDTLCELEDFTPIAPSQALGLGIAGELRRVVFGPDGEILDFGTARPYPSGALREAVTIRDRECRDPGCAVPGRHCQIDHIVPRSRGGPTAIDNLRCQCASGNRLKGTGPPLGDDPPTAGDP